jgi:hypothetical protein
MAEQNFRAYQPYRPAASRLLAKKWDDASFDLHRTKVRRASAFLFWLGFVVWSDSLVLQVRSIKSQLDTGAPKTYMHLQLKLKKLQVRWSCF